MDVIIDSTCEQTVEFESAVTVTDSDDDGGDEAEILRATKIYNWEFKLLRKKEWR